MKRRHLLLMALSLILTICMCFAFAGCDSCSDDEAPAKLSTPVVTIDDNGVATWLEVENASGYAYVIDDKPEVSTTQLSVNLADGQSVKVKAKGDGANYSDSDFSEIKTYNAPAKQPKKLASPEVTIAGDGTVTIGAVEHASKIVYVIGDGAETEYDASNKPVLTDGQTIKVTAKGDGTNYSDSDVVEKTHNATRPVDVMTHAEYTAAEKGADVCVKGIVTAFRGKNVFLADNDGGYYAFGVTEVPESLAVGVEIKVTGKKDIYNGLHEIAGGTVEITNATAVTVNPVDITAIIKNAENAGAADLIAKQNSYVTIAEAIISDVVEGTDSKGKATCTVTLTIGTKTVVYYVGGTSQLVDETQQGEIITAFKNALGKTADVTAIVAIRNNAIQLVPANATPLSDIKTTLEELDAPVVSVDQTTGKATWNEVANATRYVYKIGENGTETDAPANREVQLVKGDTIYVKAIGDGTTYGDSDWSIVKVWSNVDPDTLPALDTPATVTISEDGLTISWPQVAGAAGYKYAVGDGADVETIELSITLDTALTAGQTVKVKAVGDLINNKDSEYKTATYVAKLEAPVVEIDDNGVVTITADTNAVKVVYVIADGAETDYNADSKPTLTNGQKITVTAKGNGTAYADSDPVEMTYVALMSHAEYAAAADGANVCVKGIVTAFRSNNIFLSDNDGGYYAFRVTAVPEGLAVGVEIKVTGTKTVFNGLDEITSATVAITNATPATVNPVDITATLSAATAATDANLLALQNTYVTVKGVTITSNNTGSTITVAIGNLNISYYVGGTTQVVDATQQDTIKKAFAANNGRTADVTAIVAIRNGAIQFVPANATPISNVVLPQLSTPSVEIDEETGVATITNIDENGKAVYSIDGAEFADYDAENKPVVPYGKTIVVKAVNDGNYEESETASATYDAAQVQLAAPEISIIPVSGKVTIGEVPHATSYVYTVLDAEGNPVADKTDIPYDKTVELILEDGQSIKVVVSSSNGRYTSNEATVKYTKSNELRAPELEVDIDGNVSWGETGGANFTYTVTAKDATDPYKTVTTEGNGAQSVKINDGDTIYVKANKADDSQIDENSHSEITYYAPVQRTEGVPTDFSFTKVENQVKLTFTANSEIKYQLSFNDGTAKAQTVENGEILIDIADYTAISLTIMGTTTTGVPQAKGDYRNLFVDKDIDLKETYDTTFYNDYIAEQKVAAAKKALAGYLPELIVASYEKTLATTLEGEDYTGVEISWQPASTSYTTVIFDDSDNSLLISPDDLTDPATEAVTFTATIACGKKSDTLAFNITVKKLVTTFDTFDFTQQTDVSATIKEETAEITFDKANANNAPAWNTTNKEVRLYAKGAMVVAADNQLITKIEITCKVPDQTDNLLSADKGSLETVNTNSYVWTGAEQKVTFTVGGTKGHSKITNVVVTYEVPNLTDEEKAKKAVDALPDDFGYNVNGFTVSTIGRFDATITWSANNAAIAFTDNGDGTATATVTRGDTDIDVVVTAKVSVNGVEKEKPYAAVTVAAKPAEGQVDPITFDFTSLGTSTSEYSTTSATTVFKTACNSSDLFLGVTATTKTYPDGGKIKIGSSKATGSFTLSFSKKVTKITINMVKYGSDTGSLKVTNCSNATPPATAGDVVCTLTEAADTITFETTAKRCNIFSITFEFENS